MHPRWRAGRGRQAVITDLEQRLIGRVICEHVPRFGALTTLGFSHDQQVRDTSSRVMA